MATFHIAKKRRTRCRDQNTYALPVGDLRVKTGGGSNTRDSFMEYTRAYLANLSDLLNDIQSFGKVVNSREV
jgi:hypothetical protein